MSETAEEGIARRADPLLAPVFAARVTDWGPHLERMHRVWNSAALLGGG